MGVSNELLYKRLPYMCESLKAVFGKSFFIQAFDKSGESVYATALWPESVIKINLKTKEVTKIFQDKHVSPSHIWVDEIERVICHFDYPNYA